MSDQLKENYAGQERGFNTEFDVTVITLQCYITPTIADLRDMFPLAGELRGARFFRPTRNSRPGTITFSRHFLIRT
ncbi:hypothetical protein GCM10010470_34610 [Saccharopolyspora taberi]|uniref:Transposase n=1 Tax=Saccharopolyspora taberi TaxID=60895 RepID=A0ABN3VFR9_9PSEU